MIWTLQCTCSEPRQLYVEEHYCHMRWWYHTWYQHPSIRNLHTIFNLFIHNHLEDIQAKLSTLETYTYSTSWESRMSTVPSEKMLWKKSLWPEGYQSWLRYLSDTLTRHRFQRFLGDSGIPRLILVVSSSVLNEFMSSRGTSAPRGLFCSTLQLAEQSNRGMWYLTNFNYGFRTLEAHRSTNTTI